ncbi:carboxylesterase/lipase family protein [Sphingomonas sp. AP4-R1]|uniref:carboxylesterase/lipase family protein n=1 Tax=Sphingomonas sp. AP4-R1 TaxID=2735134 RepID=UPI0014936598|nr:carboxylesterase family protein [Sphingomonas sp. AP4-R1]QJU58304.1 carboxylesterase/lipase family protein [Sphingomonas sp. AP4-R1]
MDCSRRAILAGGAALGWATVAPGLLAADAEVVATSIAQGRLQGLRERGACVFRGIPYGGSVSSTERRFKAPPPPPSWTGVRDATVYGSPSIQAGAFPGEPVAAEDCLFLNVWTPAPDGARRPVMFYSHGGGFTVGSGNRPAQNGANLARLYDVVVVEANHRLGLFGYLYLGGLLGPEYQGNQGLLDLAAALRWVNENISAFGGDPHNVMIFGESGGGGKTAALYAMPAASPYFHKASIESPIGPGNRTPDEATDVARETMRALGLTDPRKLLELPAEQLLRAQTGEADATVPGARSGGAPRNSRDRMFWPIIDGSILPESPFHQHAPVISATKPLIVGGCKDEAVFFNFGDASAFSMSEADLKDRLLMMLGDRTDAWIRTFRASRPAASPSQLYMAIATATPWRAYAVRIAEQKAQEKRAPVFSYILDYQSENTVPGTNYPVGSPHASDIATKFNNIGPQPGEPVRPAGPLGDASPGKQATAANMSAMWAAFARTGRPTIPGQPEWKPYSLAARETMLIDAQCTLVSDPEKPERLFWEGEKDAGAIR